VKIHEDNRGHDKVEANIIRSSRGPKNNLNFLNPQKILNLMQTKEK
jgi:hypothetical protein